MTSPPALSLIGAEVTGESPRLKVVGYFAHSHEDQSSPKPTRSQPHRNPIEQNLGRHHPEPPIADA